jgi:hypothetical protein
MSDDQIRLHLKELSRLLEIKYPPLSGRVKICRLPNNPKMIDIIGNEAGIVMWSMGFLRDSQSRNEARHSWSTDCLGRELDDRRL